MTGVLVTLVQLLALMSEADSSTQLAGVPTGHPTNTFVAMLSEGDGVTDKVAAMPYGDRAVPEVLFAMSFPPMKMV